MFCAFTRPRYQVSVYKTIGPLVLIHLFTCILRVLQMKNCHNFLPLPKI